MLSLNFKLRKFGITFNNDVSKIKHIKFNYELLN